MIKSRLAVFDTLDEAVATNLSSDQVFMTLGGSAIDDGLADFYFTSTTGLPTVGPMKLERLNTNFGTLSSVVVVTTPQELSGTLDSTKLYLIDGIIDFTGTGLSIEVPQGGLSLGGHTFDISKLICSDTSYTLFTSPGTGSGNLLGMDYAVEITGASSQVYDLVSDTGAEAFEFSRVNYNDCTSLGTIDNYRQGLETGTGRFGGTPELTLKGIWSGGYFIDTSIVRGLTNGSYSLFAAGAGFTMASRFRSNQNIDLPATPSFFDFAPSQFANPSTVQLDGCLVSRNGSFDAGDATITPNMVAGDLPAAWNGNIGLDNTYEGGKVTVTTETASVISVIGTFVDLNGTYTPTELQHFDNPSLGQLRHLGNNPRNFNITFDLVIEGPSNDQVEVKILKWDDSASGFVDVGTQRRQINALAGVRDVAFFTDFLTGTLDQNDYFKMQIANNTSTGNLSAEVDGFMRVTER